MKKSDILEKVQNLVSILDDDSDYDHIKFTIVVGDFDRDQTFSYEISTY